MGLAQQKNSLTGIVENCSNRGEIGNRFCQVFLMHPTFSPNKTGKHVPYTQGKEAYVYECLHVA